MHVSLDFGVTSVLEFFTSVISHSATAPPIALLSGGHASTDSLSRSSELRNKSGTFEVPVRDGIILLPVNFAAASFNLAPEGTTGRVSGMGAHGFRAEWAAIYKERRC